MKKINLLEEPMIAVMATLIGPATVLAINKDKVISMPIVADNSM